MSAPFIIFLILVVVVAVCVAAYYSHLRLMKRQEELAALAKSFGWRFDPSNDVSHDSRYKQFDVFSQGHSRFAYNTITGAMTVDGRELSVRMGDYHYRIRTNDGKNSRTTTYRFSYLIVELPFMGDQDLFIRREGFLDKLAGFVGFDDIDFESAEFSKRFFVKSSDKKFAYDIVHPRMIEFLLGSNPPTINLNRRCCCCIRTDEKHWKLEEFRSMIGWVEGFFDRWPDHVTATFDG